MLLSKVSLTKELSVAEEKRKVIQGKNVSTEDNRYSFATKLTN